MNFQDNAVLVMTANTQGADKSILELDQKAKSLKTTLDAVSKLHGKGSEQWQKVKAELVATEAASKKAFEAMKKMDLSKLTMGQLENHVKQLNREIKSIDPNSKAFTEMSKRATEADTRLKSLQRQAKGIKDEAEKLGNPGPWQKLSGGIKTAATAMQAFVALQIVGYIIDIGKAIFNTTAKFEGYEKRLTNAFGGNVKMAKESIVALKQIAAQTTFTADQVIDGYAKMVNRGMRPTQKEMMNLADLAASQGKSLDQLIEASLDAQTGENERLKEFGITAKKSGDSVTLSFKGMHQTVKQTPEAINGAILAFGKMNGVAGQNAQMMSSLGGLSSNLEDNFDSLMLLTGELLTPVFKGLLWVLGKVIDGLKIGVNVVSTFAVVVKQGWGNLIGFFTNAGDGLSALATAFKNFISGNFEEAGKSWDKAKGSMANYQKETKVNADKAAKEIIGIWDNGKAGEKAELAGKLQGEKHGKGLSDAEKKEAEKREKEHEKELKKRQEANEKAIETIARIESEANIEGIKDELKREEAKIEEKRRKRLKEVADSLADEKYKEKLRTSINKEADAELTTAKEVQLEKQTKAATEAAQKQLEAKKQAMEAEKKAQAALYDFLEMTAGGNAKKLGQIKKERLDVELRQTVAALDADRANEAAAAKVKIVDKGALMVELQNIENRHWQAVAVATAKSAAEQKKIDEDLKQARLQKWQGVSNGIAALASGDVTTLLDAAAQMVKGEKGALAKKLSENMVYYQMAADLAKQGVQFLADMAKKKADKAIEEAKREYEQKAAMLQVSLDKEKADVERIEADKQRIKDVSEGKIQDIKANSDKAIADLEAQYRTMTGTENKAALDKQLQSYKDNADEKAQEAKDTAAQVVATGKAEMEASISQIKEKKQEAIEAATNEKEQKIAAAVATRDAEIKAINERSDVDKATKQKLIADARAKYQEESDMAQKDAKLKIDEATKEANTKMDLAKATFESKKSLAELQRDAELKAISEVKNGDLDAAKITMAKAKEDAAEKIRLAKQEAKEKLDTANKDKNDRLKVLESEKATRLANQKELNRKMQAEEAAYRAKEKAEKMKAWEAQRKADIATALITGALAVLKALANFFPLNIVFSALAAVSTGVQIAKIRSQPAPQFADGGMILKGGRHGAKYGDGGISLVDRASNTEIGEAEGNEFFMASREQTEANKPWLNQMLIHARSPSLRNKPVFPTDRPMAFRDGGWIADSPYYKKEMYLFGSRKRKKAQEEASQQEAAAAESGGGGEGGEASAGSASGEHAEAKKMGIENNKMQAEIRDGIKALNAKLGMVGGALADKLDGVQGSVNGVKDAVNNTNQSGRLDNLIGAISSFGRK